MYFRVRDGCQRARRMNVDMFVAAVLLLLLKGNWKMVTWRRTGSRLSKTYLGTLGLRDSWKGA